MKSNGQSISKVTKNKTKVTYLKITKQLKNKNNDYINTKCKNTAKKVNNGQEGEGKRK